MKLGVTTVMLSAFAAMGCARFAAKPAVATPPPGEQEKVGAFGATKELRASALPVGKMSTRPLVRPPGDVGSREQLAPLQFVATYDVPNVTSLEHAETSRPHVWNDSLERNQYCVTAQAEADAESFNMGPEWSGGLTMALPVANTEAVHAEHVEEARGTLTIVDAWADGSVRGIRPILRRTIEMKQLAELSGVKLFAFRDVRDDGTSFVQFVVSRPPVRRGSVLGSPFIIHLANGEASAAQCLHARVALPLVAGNSTMASVDVAVEVPAETIPMPSGTLTPTRARRMRVNVSAMWLARDRDATIDARVTWVGTEQSRIEMHGASTRQPTVMRNTRGDLD